MTDNHLLLEFPSPRWWGRETRPQKPSPRTAARVNFVWPRDVTGASLHYCCARFSGCKFTIHRIVFYYSPGQRPFGPAPVPDRDPLLLRRQSQVPQQIRRSGGSIKIDPFAYVGILVHGGVSSFGSECQQKRCWSFGG